MLGIRGLGCWLLGLGRRRLRSGCRLVASATLVNGPALLEDL